MQLGQSQHTGQKLQLDVLLGMFVHFIGVSGLRVLPLLITDVDDDDDDDDDDECPG